jgi:hypothetical protein
MIDRSGDEFFQVGKGQGIEEGGMGGTANREIFENIFKGNVMSVYFATKIFGQFQNLIKNDHRGSFGLAAGKFFMEIPKNLFHEQKASTGFADLQKTWVQRVSVFTAVYWLLEFLENLDSSATNPGYAKGMETFLAVSCGASNFGPKVDLALMENFPFEKCSIEHFFQFIERWVLLSTPVDRQDLIDCLRTLLANVSRHPTPEKFSQLLILGSARPGVKKFVANGKNSA